jgi:hypothetical protein
LPALVFSAALAGGAFPALAVEENTQFTTSIPADALSVSLYYNEMCTTVRTTRSATSMTSC